MTCDELRDSWELYALGVLDGEEETEIGAHLARGCPVCTPGVRSARALNTAILSLTPDARPSSKLRRRILASVGIVRGGAGLWMWAWASAAACLAVFAVTYFFQTRDARRELVEARARIAAEASDLRQTAADRDRVRQALELLEQPDTEQVVFGTAQHQPPAGRVFVNSRRGVLLLSSNLPPAPAGRIYEMWVIPKKGAPVPAGLFQSDASGNAVHILSGPIDRAAAAAFAVTEEPQSGSAAPTTKPIIVAPLKG